MKAELKFDELSNTSKMEFDDLGKTFQMEFKEVTIVGGQGGQNGKDGYTPVKGVDYYTEEEKAELITEVSEEVKEDVYTKTQVDLLNYYGGMDITPTDSALFEFDSAAGTINKYLGNETDIVIPYVINGVKVTSIGNRAFENCDIASITIPDSVTSIGNYAFVACSGLESIDLGNGITSIGDYVFVACENLTSIRIPDSVTSIGVGIFEECSSLTSIRIPDSVTSIGNSAFGNCHKLKSIDLGKGITSIGDHAFDYCESLASITIPDSVTSIGDYAFRNCTKLTSIRIPDSVTSIGVGIFEDCAIKMICSAGSQAELYCCENNIDFAFDTFTPWVLLGTQKLNSEANKISIDLGSPVTKWYSETMLLIETPVSSSLNSKNGDVTITADKANGTKQCYIFDVSSTSESYGAMNPAWKNRWAVITQWIDNKPICTNVMRTRASARAYALASIGTTTFADGDSIEGAQYITLSGDDWTFPEGTTMKLYGRF